VLQAGRILFAISFIALAIQGIVMGDFNFGRPPAWPESSLRTAWSLIGGLIVIGSCVAVLARKRGYEAALTIGVTIVVSIFLARNVPDLLSKDLAGAFWSLNAFKTLALAGGACIVAVSFWRDGERPGMRNTIFWFGTGALAWFLFVCGLAHFRFVDFIRGGFIPAYIPYKTFWTYFTGICLMAGGLGLVIRPVRRLAAIMAGCMILGWFILLHIPRAVAAPADPLEWFGVFESLGFVGICFTLAAVFSNARRSAA
jgi:uncharacterized membrane protein YphA (DoxX/SURF4 family)